MACGLCPPNLSSMLRQRPKDAARVLTGASGTVVMILRSEVRSSQK